MNKNLPALFKTNGFAILPIILIIAGVLVAAGGGTYLYKKSKVENKKENTGQQQISTSTQQVIADETANWKTYRNDKYGYEFKYPIQWDNIVESVGKYNVWLFNEDKYAQEWIKFDGTPPFYDENPGFALIGIGQYEKGGIVGPEQFVVNENTDLKIFITKVLGCHENDLRSIFLGGKLAYNCGGFIYFKFSGNILVIDTEKGQQFKDSDGLQSALNAILSTFKFIK